MPVTAAEAVRSVASQNVLSTVTRQVQFVRVRPVRMITDARSLPSGLPTRVRRGPAGFRTAAIRATDVRATDIRAHAIRATGIRSVSFRSVSMLSVVFRSGRAFAQDVVAIGRSDVRGRVPERGWMLAIQPFEPSLQLSTPSRELI